MMTLAEVVEVTPEPADAFWTFVLTAVFLLLVALKWKGLV